MTLIELLIVLALLAGLATFALTSVDDLTARSRYDVSISRLAQIREVVAGDGSSAGRFLADMGRLPMIRDTDEGEWLSELWIAPSALAFAAQAFTIHPGGGFAPISGSLYAGWAGPYFEPPRGRIFDGFGHDFTSSVAIAAGNIVPDVISLGRDGMTGGATWMDEDIEVDFRPFTNAVLQVTVRGKTTNATPAVWSEVSTLLASDTYTNAAVVLVVPDAGQSSIGTRVLTNTLTSASSTATFSGIVPGTRKIVAWGYGENEAWWSDVTTIELRPGAQHLTLHLTRELLP